MFYNNIKICRQKIGLTMKELGKVLNSSESTVSGWENGHDAIPLSKLIIFCNLYNLNIDFVIGIDNNSGFTQNNYTLNKKKIGNNLKTIRKKLNINQQTVAKDLNISQSCYSQYENGINYPTTTFLYSFSKKYNISIEKLIL